VFQTLPDESADVLDGHRRGRGIAARLVFELAFLEAPIADGDPVRNPDQLEVSKHHARALAPVVEQDVDPRGGQLVVQPVGGSTNRLASIVAYSGDGDCDSAVKVPCTPYTCDAQKNACKEMCDEDADCTRGFRCDTARSECVPSAVCETVEDCLAPLVCDATTKTCVSPASFRSQSVDACGCAVPGDEAPRERFSWMILALAGAALRRRRPAK
jgi:MYXO-CTERM domain-containing protein